ncbi:MAG: DEAD/DEAH box helicase [Bdellovibrionales bacterium]
MTNFNDLGLSETILSAIKDAGYETPTPIQEEAIPSILQMRDILGCAQTGTGKTAGFTLPMIDILAQGRARARMPRSLILEPTRELATQVAESFEKYGKNHPSLSMALLIGGENMEPQIKKLERGVDVLIATPGRLIDLFERGRIMLNDIKIFVIDEADRMLDMGFIPDIEKISSMLPFNKQTLFFSATMAPEIKKIADRFLSNPKEITVSPPSSTAKNINQSLVQIPTTNDWQKREALRHLLHGEDVHNAFIFCNRKRDVASLHKSLGRHGFNVGALHGDLDQSTRTQTLDSFRAGEISLLVCSDVAARGLDIADVSHVFNFDVPFNAEDYVHRIGRTGRAGKTGKAFTLVTPKDEKFIEAIETLIKENIEKTVIPDLPSPSESITTKKKNRRPDRHERRADDAQKRHPKKAHQTDTHAPSITKKAQKQEPDAHKHDVLAFGDSMPAFMRPRRTAAVRAK